MRGIALLVLFTALAIEVLTASSAALIALAHDTILRTGPA